MTASLPPKISPDRIMLPNNMPRMQRKTRLRPEDQISREAVSMPKDLNRDTITVAIMPEAKPTL